MSDKDVNPANGNWIEVSKALEDIKVLHTDMKAANDNESVEAKERGEKVDKTIEGLKQNIEQIEKKLTRQRAHHAANDQISKGLEDFNMCRQAAGKKHLDENQAADYAMVYEKYLHKGGEMLLLDPSDQKAMEEGRDALGGYWVMPQISARIIEKEFETSPMMEVATVETTQADRFAYFVDFSEFEAFYTAELQARSPTDTAKIGKLYIDVHTTFAKIPVSTEMLEDSTVNVTSFLTRKINNKITRIRNTNYIFGTGAGEEFGIFSPAAPTSGAGVFGEVERITTLSNSALNLDDFLNMFAALKGNYQNNASLLMSRQLLYKEILTLKDSQNRYLIDIWDRPITSNTADGRIPMSIAGFPVVFMQDMPKDISVADQDLLAFGDFRQGYSIVTRRGVTVLRDPYSLDGGVFFKVDSRGGADVTNSEAYKIMRRAT